MKAATPEALRIMPQWVRAHIAHLEEAREVNADMGKHIERIATYFQIKGTAAEISEQVCKLPIGGDKWRQNAADLWPMAQAWAIHWKTSPCYGNGTGSEVHEEILERTKQ
jgi:hypothetical protein